ncbi:MAG: hypothetical protein R3E53_16195 [Myxococcota bacterium]
MGRVHWVGGEKGGVGKSVVARLLAQYWIDRAIPWTGFDTDRSHGALLRYYSDYATPIEVDRVEDLDRIIEALDERNEEVVVDLAAQTETGLDAWFGFGRGPRAARSARSRVLVLVRDRRRQGLGPPAHPAARPPASLEPRRLRAQPRSRARLRSSRSRSCGSGSSSGVAT